MWYCSCSLEHAESDNASSDARLRYARSITSRPQTANKAELEMKRTLKAAKIQRDVVSDRRVRMYVL